jgi:hypothetical protein
LLCAEEKCIIESSEFIQQPLIFCFFLIKQKEEKEDVRQTARLCQSADRPTDLSQSIIPYF